MGLKIEVLAIGDELLVGDIVNGNLAAVGRQLTEAGFEVLRGAEVGDDIGRMSDCLREALGRVDAVVITGGLGPTQDDLTREAIAVVAGVELERRPELQDRLHQMFSRRGRTAVPEMNWRQADLPVGAEMIENRRGTAPGVLMEIPRPDGTVGVVYALPGVPHEMLPMLGDTVVPDLRRRETDPTTTRTLILRTIGLWESAVAELMAPEVDRVAALAGPGGQVNPVIAFLASGGMTRVKVTARASTPAEADALVAPVEAHARAVLGANIWGEGDDDLDATVVHLLRAKGLTVATAESLTGGLLAARLTEVPGASAVVRGGVVAYATEIKGSVLGVDEGVLRSFGAVSDATAAAMAEGARERLGADYGIALTGVAGPDEQEGKKVGTVHLGLAGPDGTITRQVFLPGDRPRIRTYACVAALDLLRRALLGEPL